MGMGGYRVTVGCAEADSLGGQGEGGAPHPIEARTIDMEPTTLLYKKNAAETVERLSRLWSRQAKDCIFAHFALPTRALTEFARTHESGPTTYPDPRERIRFWDEHLSELADVEDDWMPIAYLSEFDQGVYAGALGAPIYYMTHADMGWVSSMAPPILDSLDDVDRLRTDENADAIRLMDEQCRIFADGARGKFGVAPFIVIDAMNFVAEMRGMTQAFEDVIDNPEAVTRLMDFALELNVFIQERARDALDGFAGGCFVNMGSWAPGKPVLFSVDAYHLAHPDFYYRWGEPHLQRLLDHFGGGLLHLHSNGRHLLEHVRKLRGLLCVLLIDEEWSPRAYDHLHEFREKAGDVPLVVGCGFEEFARDLAANRLPGNVLYVVSGAPDADAANRTMERVRSHRS